MPAIAFNPSAIADSKKMDIDYNHSFNKDTNNKFSGDANRPVEQRSQSNNPGLSRCNLAGGGAGAAVKATKLTKA